MQALKDRILREGKNLGNGILKVDGFVNHHDQGRGPLRPELKNKSG